MNATQEQWRPVVGWEGLYEVSDQGRVRSLDRIVTFPDGRKRRAAGRVLKPWIKNGYPAIAFSFDGRHQKAYIHALVLEAFVGPRPDGAVCCHGDGDRQNCSLPNLRWDTYSENNYDLVEHGTHYQASKTRCPRGHEYTPENTRTYVYRGYQYRYCRQCQTESNRAYKARKRKAKRCELEMRG